jgi:hypothetical protein
MGYHITVDGAFQLTPAADEDQKARVAASDQPWRISPNGQLLYLPDEEQADPFQGLQFLVDALLPQLGLSVEGALNWHGEAGDTGQIRVIAGKVEVVEPEPERLSQDEETVFLGQLSSGVETQQIKAISALEFYCASAERVVLALAAALVDPSLSVRIRAANALGALEAGALSALDALIAALRDPEPWMQCAAAEAIGFIGPAAVSALPALRQLQKHPSYAPAGRATEAIARIAAHE